MVAARGKFEALPTEAASAEQMVGRTGNLRAPTLVCGDTVIVGFAESAYEDVLL